MNLQFEHKETIELAEVADPLLLEALEELESEQSIDDEMETELYALVHFGKSQNHTVKDLQRLEPIESRRYFQSTIVCYQCKSIGHTARDCSQNITLVCTLCGSQEHKKNRCPERVCRICSNTGHIESHCAKRYSPPPCKRCNSKTHTLPDCPKYREAAEIHMPQDTITRTCCHCGSQSHFLSTCKAYDPHSVSFFVEPTHYNGKIKKTILGTTDKHIPPQTTDPGVDHHPNTNQISSKHNPAKPTSSKNPKSNKCSKHKESPHTNPANKKQSTNKTKKQETEDSFKKGRNKKKNHK
ncbi:hypothetical protein NEOKW01_0592 [Nematocida sp. AWRm80]|nr:hypothetical protein NEOKW01_0592 [Nematocida sp. AWRm80]